MPRVCSRACSWLRSDNATQAFWDARIPNGSEPLQVSLELRGSSRQPRPSAGFPYCSCLDVFVTKVFLQTSDHYPPLSLLSYWSSVQPKSYSTCLVPACLPSLLPNITFAPNSISAECDCFQFSEQPQGFPG